MRRLLNVCIGMCVAMCAAATVAMAGLAVNPTVIEISLEPGQDGVGEYTVINKTDDAVTVTIEPVDWLKQYVQKENTVGPEQWLFFERKEFSFGPHETKKIPFTVKVPYTLQKEQVAQVFFSFQGDAAPLNMRLGVIFYLGIKGLENLRAEIKDFNISFDKTSVDYYDLKAVIAIKNTGDSHIRPSGKIRLFKQHDEVLSIPVVAGKGIFAGTDDVLLVRKKNVQLGPGTYKAVLELDCGMYDIDCVMSKKEYFTI